MGYLALVLGALGAGLFGANEWYEMVVAFGVAAVVAVAFGRLVAFVDWPRHHPRDEGRDDG